MNKKGLWIGIGCIVIAAVVLVRVGGMRKGHASAQTPAPEKAETSKETAVMPESLPVATAPVPPATPATTEIPKVTVKADEVEIPGSLRILFGQAEKKDYFTRIKAVHQLGKNLAESEVKALYVFLDRKNSEDNLQPSEIDAIKNEVSMAIARQEKKPADYAHNLMAMYYDPSHDDVWRDYCIQHLGAWYSKAEAAEQPLIAKTLWDAAGKKHLAIAGTALIALSNNTGQGISKEDVANKAFGLCEDAQCGELAKTTALQICARLGDKRALPVARRIAESGASVPLRMSAIAAVGTLGDSSDKPLLEKYASSSDARLRKSAQAALGRLK